MKKIFLQRGKDKSLLRFHPWVFSGACAGKFSHLEEGEVVEVYDADKNYLATGHFHNSSICVRVFSFKQVVPDYDFWKKKIGKAVSYRKTLSLINNPNTTIFRMVNGEGDSLPGLIIDWFDGNVVLQFHSMGMFLLRDTFKNILLELFPGQIKSIYDKSSATLLPDSSVTNDELLFGQLDEVCVRENGVPFYIDIINGQKTGFFIDQRDNRQIVGEFAKGKRVLNLFCYTGGFSGYALQGGAEVVHSVDISKKAIEWTDRNMAMLGDLATKHASYAENVFDFLNDMPDDYYDLIVLDPPAFAKHHRVKEQGIKGYRNINKKAMEKIRNGGLLFTFSCSQAIDKEDFQTTAFSAAAIAGKEVRIVKQLHQSMDHPINIFHPEGDYLKGLVLQIQD